MQKSNKHSILSGSNPSPLLQISDTDLASALLSPTPSARITCSDTTFNITNPKLTQMIRDYNRVLIEKGFGMRRRDIKRLDTIDTRNLILPPTDNKWESPKPSLTIEERQFSVSDYWYGFIPCFEEGALHINTNRYIYWKIKEINLEQNRIDIFLQDYVCYDDTGWNPGVSGVITWLFESPENIHHVTDIGRRLKSSYAVVENHPDYPTPHYAYDSIYRILDYKTDMHWTESDIAIWTETAVRYAEEMARQITNSGRKNMLESLAHIFTTCILKVNKALMDNKIQKSRPAEPVETKQATPAENESTVQSKKEPKKRRIRTIGPLEITSRSIPRASSRKTVSHYTVASWTRRGHIRTYKNGRKVYIKESTAYRKALKEQGEKTSIPTTIQFRKEKIHEP